MSTKILIAAILLALMLVFTSEAHPYGYFERRGFYRHSRRFRDFGYRSSFYDGYGYGVAGFVDPVIPVVSIPVATVPVVSTMSILYSTPTILG